MRASCVINQTEIMKEVQLSHVWEYQLFDAKDLRSSKGELIRILDQGVLNVNSGPDFIDAQIYVDGLLMVGDVEIHIKSSDYLKHGHRTDAAYGKMILHVVYEEDVHLPFLNCPTVELKGRVPLQYLRHVQPTSKLDIYCRSLWRNDTAEKFKVEMERTWRERLLKNRQAHLDLIRRFYPYDVKLLYQLLFRVFGQPVNQDAMELLFARIPFEKMMGRLSIMDWEAVLLGVGGFLTALAEDVYIIQLRERYRILKMRFALEEIPASLWRFSRMRPANFPPVRLIQLAQLCALLPNSLEHLKKRNVAEALQWLHELDIQTSLFWQEPRVLQGYTIKASYQLLSKQMKASVFANAFIPYFIALEEDTQLELLIESVSRSLAKLPAETNHVILQWNRLLPSITSMADTQMILAQYKLKCIHQKCMDCLVGISVCKD
jgi:hypothetical protein